MDPRCIDLGPDLKSMLQQCDGALLIGDRALRAASEYPSLVQLDLGAEWTRTTGLPMVFGIFAAHRSADEELMVEARTELVANYRSFLRDQSRREEVVRLAAGKIGLTPDRMDQYFLSESRTFSTRSPWRASPGSSWTSAAWSRPWFQVAFTP